MNTEKRKSLLKIVVLTIILFAIYVLIINLAKQTFQSIENFYEAESKINILCIAISTILTLIYNLMAKKFLNLNYYEKLRDYILSLLIFLIVDIIYYFIVPMPQEEYGWFGSTFVRIDLSIQSLSMYVFGSSMFFVICYVLRSIRNRDVMNLLKRTVLAIVLFIIYVLFPRELIFVFTIWAIPLFYSYVSIKILGDSREYLQQQIVSMGLYICVTGVWCFIFEEAWDSTILIVISQFAYLFWYAIHDSRHHIKE